MCQVCGARTQAEHEQWLIQFYQDRKKHWLNQGDDMVTAVKRAMFDVDRLVDRLGVDA